MEEDHKASQMFKNLDIEYLKSEKNSLIKSNHAYSETIGKMELEISDLKAMIQALENENQSLACKLSKYQENSSDVTVDAIETIKILKLQITALNEEKLKSEKNLKEIANSSETDDLIEEVNELRDELKYLKAEYIPKLENQLENSRFLIIELENEIKSLNDENESFKKHEKSNFATNANHFVSDFQRREFLQPTSPTEYLKEEKFYKPQQTKMKVSSYMPSIKRIEKNKTPEFMISLSKNN